MDRDDEDKARVQEEQAAGGDGQEAQDVEHQHDALMEELVTGPLRRLFAPQVARFAVRDFLRVDRSHLALTCPIFASRPHLGVREWCV